MAKILLVEDSTVAALAACSVIEEAGHSVEVVTSGQQALERYGDGFNLILLDIGLPGIDGITLAKTIRSQNSPSKNIPIIALTAHDDEQTKANALKAGMNGYLCKPLEADSLSAVLSDYQSR